MAELLEQVKLTPEQEEKIPTDKVRKYVKIMLLEDALRLEKESVRGELSEEEMEFVESCFQENFPIPDYLTVQEVSMITALSKQMVRRNCVSGKFKGFQSSGENGIWSIEKEQFLAHPNWDTFVKERNEKLRRSKKAAEIAMQMCDIEETEEETEEK